MTLRAALYARYSTDKQSKDSAEDQFRVCRATAEREKFKVVAQYADPGITGGTAQRPQYQALLAAARRGEFEIIVAEDVKRLWREQAEQWRAIKELLDLKVGFVTVSGIDSRQKNFEMIVAVMGAAGELDRKEAAYRTHRGLEGRARKILPTGGRSYG
jgi:site-specific DNA recombinase